MKKSKNNKPDSVFVIAFTADLPLGIKLLVGKKTKNNKFSFFGGKLNKETVYGGGVVYETSKEGAYREFEEETGYKLKELYKGNSFNLHGRCIHIFSTIIDKTTPITLSKEHSRKKWITLEEALLHLNDFTPSAQAILTRIHKGVLFGRCDLGLFSL